MRTVADPGVRVVSASPRSVVAELKARPGKDIWLGGGGELFRSCLAEGCVDTVQPAVIPILLGGGIPLLPAPAAPHRLRLAGQRVYAASGIVLLRYDVLSGVPG